ncbi:MAG: LptF/LptG family permease [Candidatus Lightella neohaematopini]|nr:LptF/LptG family permease [Candidatus Lightella neohaematopini]
MIIIKYIFRKMCKVQTLVILILVLIFFFHKIIRILKLITIGYVSKNLAIILIILKIPEIIQIVTPISIIISVFIIIQHMRNNNELLAIYSCGYNKNIIHLVLLIISIFVMFFTIINSMWIVPISNRYYCQLLFNSKQNNINQLIINNLNNNIQNNNIITNRISNNIFLIKIKKNKYYLASTGNIYSFIYNKNYKLIILHDGNNYYYDLFNHNLITAKFKKYYLFFDIKKNKKHNLLVNQLSLNQLISNINNITINELHWRCSLLLSIPLFYLLSTTMLISNIKKILSTSFIMILYALFFIIQHLLRISTVSYSYLLIWLIYVCYLVITILIKYLTDKLLL